jgi:Ca2+-binding RTX toxin-like protein
MPTIKGDNKNNKLVGDTDLSFPLNLIYGYGGNDILEGGFQADNSIWGGAGNDTIEGGTRLNRLYGGAGDDRITVLWSNTDSKLFGGAGNDTLVASATFAGARGVYMDGGTGIDLMIGGAGDDIFIVNSAKDVVQDTWLPEFDNQSDPIDTVRASVSFTLDRGTRVEVLESTSATGREALVLTGNEFAQSIAGNAGHNVLSGMAGNDTLLGGIGKDALSGGSGRDTFVFASIKDSTLRAQGRDTIHDFKGQSGDRFDLRKIDADTTTLEDQEFLFLGKAQFSKTAGELRYEVKSGQTFVYGDVNGDGKADFAVHLKGTLGLSSDYFLL